MTRKGQARNSVRSISKVLVIGFWGVNDPLTRATIIPTIHLIHRRKYADHTWLVTVERTKGKTAAPWLLDNITHVPLQAQYRFGKAIDRVWDLIRMPWRIHQLIAKEGIGLIVARTSMAGILAFLTTRLVRIPYVIESLEPHSEYMVECGEWGAGSLIARGTRFLEDRSITNSFRALPVTFNYAYRLMQDGVTAEKIHVVPCPVDLNAFHFDPEARERIREKMDWNNSIVSVYLGKFGGLYLDDLAFQAFKRTDEFFGDRSRLMILTGDPREVINKKLDDAGIHRSKVFVACVSHDQVPQYLSAADLAFSTYKDTPSSAYLSPVKNGEYWANGLPIILPKGVSDDSRWIQNDPDAGALFDPRGDDVTIALAKVYEQITSPGQRAKTMAIAAKLRSTYALGTAYEEVFNSLNSRPYNVKGNK